MLKKINDFIPGLYDRYFISDSGDLFSDYGNYKMSDNALQNGYIVNSLFGPNGKRIDIKRHRLMALIFLPKPTEDQTQINHINGVKTDNRAVNLEWCTSKENINHAWSHGLAETRKGSKSNWAKLTEKEVLEIAKLLEEGKLQGQEIAKIYNVHKATISSIKCRKNWAHLTKDFNF